MRSYATQDIVTLPTLNIASAIALGQQLLTALKAHTTLPQLVSDRARALTKAHATLCRAYASKPPAQIGPRRARVSDQAEDQAFSAFYDWLYGWCKLATPEADKARTMLAVLFPNGLKFTHLPHKQGWAEAQAKLARITTQGYDKEIQKLGGKPLLDQLITAHEAYGESLRITIAEQNPAIMRVRETLLAFNRYLRAYVVAVSAHTDPDDPTSSALADALLAPLYKWVTYVTVAEEVTGDATAPALRPRAMQAEATASPRVPTGSA